MMRIPINALPILSLVLAGLAAQGAPGPATRPAPLPESAPGPQSPSPQSSTSQSSTSQSSISQCGGVVAIGGGKLPDAIYRRILDLTGSGDPNILILPLATAEPDVAGPRTEQRFRENGAQRVDWKTFRRADANETKLLDAIAGAHVVFFPGGDQKRILEALRGTDAAKAIRDVLSRGGVIGGTSAGCEVLGDLSLTGPARTDLAVLGSTEVEPGLAFVPGVVFDQHFLRRSRFLRLLSATLDAPKKVGIGVDESTAVVLPHGTRTIEVLGERQVTIFRLGDDTRAQSGARGDLARTSNLRLHLLAAGDRYDLDRDLVTFSKNPSPAPQLSDPSTDDADPRSPVDPKKNR